MSDGSSPSNVFEDLQGPFAVALCRGDPELEQPDKEPRERIGVDMGRAGPCARQS